MVVGGQKMTKKIDFSKNFDFCDFWFFCVFRCARGCWTFCSLWMYYKKLQKVGCGDEKTILRENGFSPTDIEKVFFWPIFSRRLSPPAVPGNSYGRWGESSVLMLSLKAPKNKKVKIFEFLTPPTWRKVQLIAIQRPKSLKDYFLESRFMAACKNSANSNGGFSRTRRGVFILNTYRSTPYLERRADGAPPPVLTETGCTSSGHLVVFSGPWGPRLQNQVFRLWSGVPPVIRRIFIISKVCYDFYLAVHFGHWQLALLQVFFFRLLFENVKKTGGNECEASGSLRGHVVGQAPHNMPSKNFWKN